MGEVFASGAGDCGQLGKGRDFLEANRPKRVDIPSTFGLMHVEAGGMHSLALDSNLKLFSWGCNDQKALGRGGDETVPASVSALDNTNIVKMKCGDSFSVALSDQGQCVSFDGFAFVVFGSS